ncbi:MAG: FAD:protein FMN transferase [Treponema sp.]|nr:FAD:protein FMN transferase [Treponema sp.]
MSLSKRFETALLIFCASFFFPLISVSCVEKKFAPHTETVLGTVCTIQAYEDGSEKLYEELFETLFRIESLFSVNIPTSDISRVNEAAGEKSVAVDEEVAAVVEKALFYARKSGGAFDPAIGPLVKLWGINTDSAKVPSQEEIDGILPLVDYSEVTVDRSGGVPEIFLHKQGMALDLGGIAKGYAADCIRAELEKNKVKRAVVDLGGNVYVYGRKKDGSAWKVGIKNPFAPEDGPALILSLETSSSVVTSGVYERFFEKNGKTYHHILDTSTGYPAEKGSVSVTIISESSLAADALSTTAFILGPEKFFETFSEPAVFFSETGSVIASSVLKGRLSVAEGLPVTIEYR